MVEKHANEPAHSDTKTVDPQRSGLSTRNTPPQQIFPSTSRLPAQGKFCLRMYHEATPQLQVACHISMGVPASILRLICGPRTSPRTTFRLKAIVW